MKDVILFFINTSVFSKLKENKRKAKLDKKFNATLNSDIKIPPKVNVDSKLIKKRKKYTKKIEEYLFNFERILKKENFNLDTYYANLRNLKISKSNLVERFFNRIFCCDGWYSGEENKVSFEESSDAENTIYHELLHAASCTYDKKRHLGFLGFNQINYKNLKSIGKGLNEGYTEFLNKCYFSPNSHSYWVETVIAKMFENIIGREKMSLMFFKSDLNGLIEEFSKYNTRENIIKFIVCFDFVSDNLNKKYTAPIREKLNECIRFIYDFLIESYYNYLNFYGLELTYEKSDVLLCFKFELRMSLGKHGDILKTDNLNKHK